VYVNDLGNIKKREHDDFKNHLEAIWDKKDLGDISHSLGIEFKRDGDKMMLCQKGYIKLY